MSAIATTLRTSERGFALIVALALMTLIILVVVATALLVKVDTEGSLHERSLTEARQNALTGLNRALGDLQTYAGPDQRTSARADLVNASADQPYWTGIWHTAPLPSGTAFERGTAPVWLVSSEGTPDPASGPAAARSVELVRSTSGGSEQVLVEKVSLPSTGNDSPGEFAYWVGDEGTKVHIGAAEPEDYAAIDPATAAQVRRLSGAHQAAWETLLGGTARVAPSDAERLESRQSIPLVGSMALGTHFHDVTAHSVSLLTNTRNGGIREDLSRILFGGFTGNSDYSNTAPLLPSAAAPMNSPTWGLLRSFHQMSTDLGVAGSLNPSVTVRPQSASQHGVFPLIAMIQMNWHARWVPVSGGGTPTQVQFAAQPVITLVNPYNVSLASANYLFRIRYTSADLTLGIGSVDAPSLSVSIDLQTSFDTAAPATNMIMLRTSPMAFAPGESKVLSLSPTAGNVSYVPNAPSASRILLAPGLNLIHSMAVGAPQNFAVAPGQNPWLRIGNGAVLAQLYQGSSQLHYINDIYYATTHIGSYDLNNPAYLPNRMILRTTARNIIARGGTPYRQDHSSGAQWLAHYNLRVPLSRRDTAGAWISNPLYQGLWDAATEPDSYSVATSGDNAYWGESSESGQTHNVLFDIPRQPLISLGTLQHANLSPETWYPAYPFGNSWASPYVAHNAADFSYQLNEAFWDRYFFSALPVTMTDWPARSDWQSPRLFPLSSVPDDGSGSPRALGYEEVGAYLGVRGGFNVNSTSEAAWGALLKSLQGQSVPVVDPVQGTSGAVASGSNIPFLRSSVANGPAGDLWRGFRVLTPAQVDRLASSIVEVIRERGPFRSLASFVNRDLTAGEDDPLNLCGPLQLAIDRSGINVSSSDPAAPWTGTPSVPPEASRVQTGDTSILNLTYPEASTGPRATAAPGFITQGDLLSLLGPVLSARSDTFVIRAYGNTLNRANGSVEAEVWCEAVVQRLPDYMNPADPPHLAPALAENVRFGRRFRIVSFRWISPDEL